jgi:hypothetical protein
VVGQGLRRRADLAGAWAVLTCAGLVLGSGCQPQRRVIRPPAAEPPRVAQEAPVPSPLPPPSPITCPPLWGAPEEGGTIRLAVQEAVDPAHAPVPANDAERIIFRQVYETLLQADRCGNFRPGLAAHWRTRDGGQHWEFELREDARFWDGTPLDRSAVRRAWATRRRKAGPEEAYFPWSWIASVSELDPNPRVLVVELTTPLPRPDLFLHPALAVALDDGSSAWPLGSGPFRPAPADAGMRPGRMLLSLALHPYHPAGQGGECPTWPAALAVSDSGLPSVLLIDVSPGADPRDLLAQGADVVWMRSLREIEYARLTGAYTLTALPWDRIYALVAEASGQDRPPQIGISRAHLAVDAMDSDARSASALAFARLETSTEGDTCAGYGLPPRILAPVRLLPDAASQGLTRRHLLYESDDRDAERLAGRLVALDGTAGLDLGLSQVAPVAGEVLRTECTREGAPACIVRLARALPDPCLEELALWRWGARRPIVPLVAVRPYLVTRRGLGGVEVLWDGTPLFAAAGWGAPDQPEGDEP